MTRSLRKFVQALVVTFLAVTAGIAVMQGERLPANPDLLADAISRGRLFDAMADRFEALYWDPARIDWAAWRAEHRPVVTRAETPVTFDGAMRRAVAAWQDGHSRWLGRRDDVVDVAPRWRFDPPVVEPSDPGGPTLDESAGDRMPDLGAEVRPVDGVGLLVVRAYPGAAADAAGLTRGDVIVAVGDTQLDAPGMHWRMLDAVLMALRAGSAALRVDRPSMGLLDVRVTPRDVPEGSRYAATLTIDPATRVALLSLPTFDAGSAQRVHALLEQARREDVAALVIDVRGNPGGSVLDLALTVAAFLPDVPLEAWLPDEPAWSVTIDRRGDRWTAALQHERGPFDGARFARKSIDDAVSWTGPLALLVDAGTASAAEGFVALVADGRPGVIVAGETTAGNVESVRRVTLPGGFAAWLAVAELRHAGGSELAPIDPGIDARLEDVAFARGFDEPYARAVRALLDLPLTVGRWF